MEQNLNSRAVIEANLIKKIEALEQDKSDLAVQVIDFL